MKFTPAAVVAFIEATLADGNKVGTHTIILSLTLALYSLRTNTQLTGTRSWYPQQFREAGRPHLRASQIPRSRSPVSLCLRSRSLKQAPPKQAPPKQAPPTQALQSRPSMQSSPPD